MAKLVFLVQFYLSEGHLNAIVTSSSAGLDSYSMWVLILDLSHFNLKIFRLDDE